MVSTKTAVENSDLPS